MKLFNRFTIMILAGFSSPCFSMDMAAMMKQEMQNGAKQTCSDQAFLSCMGTSGKKCLSAANKAIKTCNHLFPTSDVAMGDGNAFMAHSSCMDKTITKNLGVSIDKLNDCDPGGGPSASAPPMQMEQGMAMVSQMMQQHAKSVGTGRVTLPVYKNATVMSHIADDYNLQNLQQDLGVRPLPALMLASPDSIKSIATYYRDKLKGFKEYRTGRDILFMQNGPKNFDYTRDYNKYTTTPHVLIMPMDNVPGSPPGSRSKIEISYKK